MSRVLFSILLLICSSFGGKSDSVKIIELSAKVDSLARQLEMQHFEAAVNKEAYTSTNQRIDGHIETIINGSTSIFAGIIGGVFAVVAIVIGVNFFMARREADSITIKVKDDLMGIIRKKEAELEELKGRMESTRGEYTASLTATENGFKDRFTMLQTAIENKVLSLWESNYPKLQKEIAFNRIFSIAEFYYLSKDFYEGVDYLIQESNKMINEDQQKWKKEIHEFCRVLEFRFLEEMNRMTDVICDDFFEKVELFAKRIKSEVDRNDGDVLYAMSAKLKQTRERIRKQLLLGDQGSAT